MKTYNTQAEAEADIVGGKLIIRDDVTFNCDIKLEADIHAWNIKASDIDAWDITAGNIKASDIKASDIKAWNIKAGNIIARNINAWDIDARDIFYFAFVLALHSFTCRSLKARRKNGLAKCLDSEIVMRIDVNSPNAA